MTYEEYKQITTAALEKDIWEAKCQVAWYKSEVRDHKYNGVSDAIEKLKVWEERLASLTRRSQQLKEMFKIFEDTLS